MNKFLRAVINLSYWLHLVIATSLILLACLLYNKFEEPYRTLFVSIVTSFLASYLVSILFDRVSKLTVEDVEERVKALILEQTKSGKDEIVKEVKSEEQASRQALVSLVEEKIDRHVAAMMTSEYSRGKLTDEQFQRLSEIIVHDEKRFPMYFSKLISQGLLKADAVYNNYISHLYAGPFYDRMVVKSRVSVDPSDNSLKQHFSQTAEVNSELIKRRDKKRFFVAFGHSIMTSNLCTVSQNCDLYVGVPRSNIQQFDSVEQGTAISIRYGVGGGGRHEQKIKLSHPMKHEDGMDILNLDHDHPDMTSNDVKFFECACDAQMQGELEFELTVEMKLTSQAAPFLAWKADRFTRVKSIEFDLTAIKDSLEASKIMTYFANVGILKPEIEYADQAKLKPCKVVLSINDCLLPGQGAQIHWRRK